MSRSATVRKMGSEMEAQILENSLVLHNNPGEITYKSREAKSVIDITLSQGLTSTSSWSTTKDIIQSPHKCICLSTNSVEEDLRLEVIDWKNFDWPKYKLRSAQKINSLIQDWSTSQGNSADWADTLQSSLSELQSEVATTKIITKHSRPWFCPDVKDILSKLKEAKSKVKRHKSQSNIDSYNQLKEEASSLIQEAKDQWLMSECEGLQYMSDSARWKARNKLTNQVASTCVQPIQTPQGDYHFEDKDILKDMEQYHIHKGAQPAQQIHSLLEELDVLFDQSAESMPSGSSAPTVSSAEPTRRTISETSNATVLTERSSTSSDTTAASPASSTPSTPVSA